MTERASQNSDTDSIDEQPKKPAKKSRLKCGNCNGPHHIDECKDIPFCLFCCQKISARHSCDRNWVKEINFESLSSYRQKALQHIVVTDSGKNYDEVFNFCVEQKKKFDEVVMFREDDVAYNFEVAETPAEKVERTSEPRF